MYPIYVATAPRPLNFTVSLCNQLFLSHSLFETPWITSDIEQYKVKITNSNNMPFLYSALSLNELRALYILLPPAHLDTPTPSLSGTLQPGYTLQGATGDQSTIAFFVYCQVLILRLNEPEHISGTNPVRGLWAPKTKCMAQLEPTISWWRVQCLNH